MVQSERNMVQSESNMVQSERSMVQLDLHHVSAVVGTNKQSCYVFEHTTVPSFAWYTTFK